MDSNYIDLAIFGYLLFCIVRGIQKGLIGVLASILGVYGAALIVWVFHPKILSIASSSIGYSSVFSNGMMLIVLWLIAYLIICGVGRLITYMITLGGGGFFLRILGGILNGGKGLILVSMLVSFVSSFASNYIEFSPKVLTLAKIGDSIIGYYTPQTDDGGVHMIEPELLLYD